MCESLNCVQWAFSWKATLLCMFSVLVREDGRGAFLRDRAWSRHRADSGTAGKYEISNFSIAQRRSSRKYPGQDWIAPNAAKFVPIFLADMCKPGRRSPVRAGWRAVFPSCPLAQETSFFRMSMSRNKLCADLALPHSQSAQSFTEKALGACGSGEGFVYFHNIASSFLYNYYKETVDKLPLRSYNPIESLGSGAG